MIRVCVVDDQTLVRVGLRSLLDLSEQVTVSAEAADGDEALEIVRADPPDVLLLDLRMPGLDGIGTLEALAAEGIEVPVLVLTTFDDDELVLRALRAGARGYLLKDVTLDHLVGAIEAIAAGDRVVQPGLTDRVVRSLGQLPGNDDADLLVQEPLTSRETEVLRLLASGWSNREIAEGLHLAEGTVKNHVSGVLLKLGVRDRTRAVLRALQLGLLGEDGPR